MLCAFPSKWLASWDASRTEEAQKKQQASTSREGQCPANGTQPSSSNLVEAEQPIVFEAQQPIGMSVKAQAKRQSKAKAKPTKTTPTDNGSAKKSKKTTLRGVAQEHEVVKESGVVHKPGKRVLPADPDHKRRVRFLPDELIDFKAFWLGNACKTGVDSPFMSRKLGESRGNPMYELGEQESLG